MELQETNTWWIEKKVKENLLHKTYRDIFLRLKSDLDRKQLQILVGLRRVGKTTLLLQIIDGLIKDNVNPLNIVYCSFYGSKKKKKRIEDILKDYSRITGIDYQKEKIFLFLDEVQKSKKWVDSIKLVYDNFKNIKILISGSASLNILSEAKKSLAGRAIYYELRPLSFKEFLNIKGINIEDGNFLIYSDTLKKEFNNFLIRPFPELVNEEDNLFIKQYIRNSVIEPIILKDIPKEFKEIDILLLEKLVEIFLTSPGQYLELDNLAKELKRAKTTLYNALFYLEFSFLIRKILNFRPSVRIASRKLSRIYAYHPVLCLPFNIPQEKYAENLVFFELDTRYYWRDKEKEIDFLKDLVPVEVKYKEKIDKRDVRWIDYFLKKYGKQLNVKAAFVITTNTDDLIGKIKLIPLWKFCYTGLK